MRIHRGVYEAAQKLYDDILPLVKQHVATSPFATVSFTGEGTKGAAAKGEQGAQSRLGNRVTTEREGEGTS